MSIAVENGPPLCVELEGTLIHSDLLLEHIAGLLRQKPLLLLVLPFWALRGRTFLKRQLASHVTLNETLLPWNLTFLDWLKGQHAEGRSVWLATDEDEVLAQRVSERLGIFDSVITSNGDKKYQALCKAVGQPFVYAGNSRADLEVWKHCDRAVVVNARPGLLQRVKLVVPEVTAFDCGRKSLLKTVLRAMRVHQWAKNVLILVPLITSHQIFHWQLVAPCLIAMFLFGLCSSAQYVLNDLIDLESDRRHPTKGKRPFASGDLPISVGLIGGPLLLVVGVGLGLMVSQELAAALLLYFAISFSYSLRLKRVLLVDVFALSGLYGYRILVGHLVTGVAFSEWLIMFAYLLFLSLGFSKRATELLNAQSSGRPIHGRGYLGPDLQHLNIFGVCAAFLAAVVFLMYLQSDRVKMLYQRPELLWFLCPLLLYWLTRIWLLSGRGAVQEDPLLFVLRDRVSYLVAAVAGVIMFAARGLSH